MKKEVRLKTEELCPLKYYLFTLTEPCNKKEDLSEYSIACLTGPCPSY